MPVSSILLFSPLSVRQLHSRVAMVIRVLVILLVWRASGCTNVFVRMVRMHFSTSSTLVRPHLLCKKAEWLKHTSCYGKETQKTTFARPKWIFIPLNKMTGFLCNRPNEDELEYRQKIPRHHLSPFVFLFTDGSIKCAHFSPSTNLHPRMSGAHLVKSCLMASSMQTLAQLYSKNRTCSKRHSSMLLSHALSSWLPFSFLQTSSKESVRGCIPSTT